MNDLTLDLDVEACSQGMHRDAVISTCGIYRYSLTRTWDTDLKSLCIIGLNPSTADAFKDDPTIRRCIGFGQRWGYGSLVMVNLFAYRATDPTELLRAKDRGLDIIGEMNDEAIVDAASACSLTICAWGSNKSWGRDRRVLTWLMGAGIVPHVFRLNNDGGPGHPLYLPGNIECPMKWDL